MKLSVFAASALLMGAAFGAVSSIETSNTFGVMKVTCSDKKAIVCTPWVKAVTAGDVAIKDLVMTQGLEEGDAIVLYAGGGFKMWKLTSGAWEGVAVTDVNGTFTAGGDDPIARGAGFWFIKNESYSSGSYDLYLYGQDTDAAATSTITKGAYNLIANPTTAEVNLVAKVTAGEGDSIQLPGPKVYTYEGTQWKTWTTKTVGSRTVTTKVAVDSIPLAAGMGCWYVSKNGSGTVAW